MTKPIDESLWKPLSGLMYNFQKVENDYSYLHITESLSAVFGGGAPRKFLPYSNPSARFSWHLSNGQYDDTKAGWQLLLDQSGSARDFWT